MKKGRELKKRTAALLIASMVAGSMATPALAEPVEPVNPAGITTVDGTYDFGGDFNAVNIFCTNGHDARIYEEDGATLISLDDGTAPVVLLSATASDMVAVYAGTSDNSEVTEPVTLTMESGKVDFLVGSSVGNKGDETDASFKVAESTINLKGGTVNGGVIAAKPLRNGYSFSKCGDMRVDKCTINILGGTVGGQVAGVFGYGEVGEMNMNISGGKIKQRVNLGGTNGHVETAKLSVTGGDIAWIAACQRTLVDEADISITGGTVGDIYAGSYYPDEETSEGAKASPSNAVWNGWSAGGVDYGIAKDVQITISGKAKYNSVYGGFQHGVQKASSSEIDVFLNRFTGLSEEIKNGYNFKEPTRAVINYSVKPSKTTSPYKYTKDLIAEGTGKTEGVEVNDYTSSKLTMSETGAKMKLGESRELTAEYEGVASPSEASPSEAAYVWESSNEDVVAVTAGAEENQVTLDARKPGSATVRVNYRGMLEASCDVTVEEPKLSLTLPSKMDYTDEDTWLRAHVDNVGDNVEVTYEADADKPGLSCEEDGDGEFLMVPEYGLSGDYKITVKASLSTSGEDYTFEGTKNLTVNKPKFAVKVTDGSTSLDAKGAGKATLEAAGDYEYDTYEWSVEGDAVELTSPSDGQNAVVTAVKEGTATVRVIAKDNSHEITGPNTGDITIPGAEAEAKITIKVADTREFKADKSYVELDINPDAAKLSDTVKITNDYGDAISVKVVKNTQPVTAEIKGNTVTVSTTAKETGSATVEISRENGGTITIPVIIKTTAIVADVTTGIEVEVKADAVAAPVVKTEGLSEEQKAEVEVKTAEQTEEIKNSIVEVFDAVAADEEVAEELASKTVGMEKVAMEFATDNGLKVENGDIVKVYPKQEVKNVALESAVVVDEETGAVTTTTVIKKMELDISLKLDKMDENNTVVAGGTLNVPKTNTKPISFPVPLPVEGISSTMHYVKVTHAGDVTYSPIQESKGIKYTVITTYHFSPFILEFVESLPVVHKSSGRSGGSYSTGKWLQSALGWQYKGSDGAKVTNCWKQLLWNNQMQWYHFDAAGYMTAGWFTDVDGNRYFLHNISDGNQGRMYTGWNQIEGKWYYFKENAGGPMGSLLVNGITPDGYQTDAAGSCSAYNPK